MCGVYPEVLRAYAQKSLFFLSRFSRFGVKGMMMMIGKTMIIIVNGDDASEFSLSIDAGGREADILAAGTTPLNSDPIVFTIIAIVRGSIITIM